MNLQLGVRLTTAVTVTAVLGVLVAVPRYYSYEYYLSTSLRDSCRVMP
eukprot:SAG11_NODE_42744_length_175_cov_171.539474_1_plen_47_part_01